MGLDIPSILVGVDDIQLRNSLKFPCKTVYALSLETSGKCILSQYLSWPKHINTIIKKPWLETNPEFSNSILHGV